MVPGRALRAEWSELDSHPGDDLAPPCALRLAIFTNAPAPYRDQLYRRLVSLFASVKVHYTDPPHADRSWQVSEECDSERLDSIVSLGPLGALQPGVLRAVRRADVLLVGGYEHASYVLAMVTGRLLRRKVVLFFDGIAPSRLGRKGIKRFVKRSAVRLAHLSLVNGSVGREYFEKDLGFPSDRIRNQYLVPLPRAQDLPKRPTVDVLFVGRLIERKGVDTLIAAVRGQSDLSVRIIGEGPARDELVALAQGCKVEFFGAADRDEIDAQMSAAGCLVVPSRDEPWGLVVQEALQNDVPVVVSDDVGAARDLVDDDVNGAVFRAGEPDELLGAVRRAMKLDRAMVKSRNAELLSDWNLESHVSAFADAVYELKRCTERQRRSAARTR